MIGCSIVSNAEEKSSNASTDMLPLLRERNRSLTTFRRAVQCCGLDDMLIGKHCEDCES